MKQIYTLIGSLLVTTHAIALDNLDIRISAGISDFDGDASEVAFELNKVIYKAAAPTSSSSISGYTGSGYGGLYNLRLDIVKSFNQTSFGIGGTYYSPDALDISVENYDNNFKVKATGEVRAWSAHYFVEQQLVKLSRFSLSTQLATVLHKYNGEMVSKAKDGDTVLSEQTVTFSDDNFGVYPSIIAEVDLNAVTLGFNFGIDFGTDLMQSIGISAQF